MFCPLPSQKYLMVPCLTWTCQDHGFSKLPASLEFDMVPERTLMKTTYVTISTDLFFFSQVLYLLEHLLTTFSCYNLILEKHAQSILLNISTQFKYSNTFKSHRTTQGTYLGQNVKWAPPQLWSSLHSNIGIKQCMPQDQAAEGIQSSSENHAEPLPFFCKFTVDDS